MARVLLQLGNRKNRLVAKRVGQRLLLLSQACPPRRALEVFVHELLGDIGELLLPDKREKNWASRIRTSVEEALELLRTHGVLKTVEWPDGFGPGNIDRSKGWSDRWLNARIRVTTVANRRAESGPARASRSHGKRLDRTAGVVLVGTDIRFARTNIVPFWTQEELARELKISHRHVSQIETGKRKPSPRLAEQLRDWVETRKEKERQAEFRFGHKRGESEGCDAVAEVKDNVLETRPQHDSSTFRQMSLKSSRTERAGLNSSAEPASESLETTNEVPGRRATRQGPAPQQVGAGRGPELTRGSVRATRSKEMLYSPGLNSELDRALHTLKEIILEGLDHGYFEYSIRCEKANSDTRILTITAGMSHRFSIPPGDLKHQR